MTEPAKTASEKSARTLAERIAAVMGKLERIRKGGRNKHFDYAFVTEADVSDAVREAMAGEGLAAIPSIEEHKSEERKTAGGKATYLTTLKLRVRLTDGNQIEDTFWMGQALDAEDKGIQKAATAALKYFFLKLFVMSAGDVDTDNDGGEDEQETPWTPERIKSTIEDASKHLADCHNEEDFNRWYRSEGKLISETAPKEVWAGIQPAYKDAYHRCKGPKNGKDGTP